MSDESFFCVKYDVQLSKTCSKCKAEKSLDNFHAQAGTKDGLQYICKKCSGQACGQRYKKKSREVLEYNKQWLLSHPEALEEKIKRYNNSPTGKISLRINRALDRLLGKERQVFSEIIGCGPSCLVIYLTVRLKDPLLWTNYGDDWVVGFINSPKDKSEYGKCCYYKNLTVISKNGLKMTDLEIK